AGGRVEDARVLNTMSFDLVEYPRMLIWSGSPREGARIPVRICSETFPRPVGGCNALLRLHRIPVDPQHVHEPLAVGVGREERGQDRGTGRDERAVCPPDVEIV